MNTGLVFEINDIDFPSLFMTAPFETAKKWERVLQQASAGTLAKQEKPRHVL